MQVSRELAGRLQIVPERLLDCHPLPVRHQVGFGQAFDHDGEQRRRSLEVEHRVVVVAERLGYLRVQRVAVEVAADVAESRREPPEHVVVAVLAGLLDRFARTAAEVLVAEVLARHSEHREVEQPAPLEPVERPERLLPGQVAGYAEDDQRVGFAFAHRLALLRFDLPRARSFLASATSSAAGLPWSRPVSSTPGSLSNRGSDMNTAQPFSPRSPSPMIAWRSRFEPSGTAESLTWRAPSRSQPTVRSKSSMTSASESRVRTSYPEANRWQESRQMPSRLPPPPASIRSASSSNERPSVPPAPAVSSSRSGHLSVSARASLMTLPARLIALGTSPVFAEPGCRTTPTAPIPAPTRNDWRSEVSDFSRISRSSVAELMR